MDDAFRDAYYAIDKDMSGVISKEELVKYQKENKYDDVFVTKWLRLFDRENSGNIRVEEFCEVLGLELREFKAHHAQMLESGGKRLPDDCEVIYTDMTEDFQYDVFQIVVEANRKYNEEVRTPQKEIKERKDIVQYVKQQCDIRFEKLWHVVMVKGQYWSYYSHEPENSFIFKYLGHIYLIFRTPAP